MAHLRKDTKPNLVTVYHLERINGDRHATPMKVLVYHGPENKSPPNLGVASR